MYDELFLTVFLEKYAFSTAMFKLSKYNDCSKLEQLDNFHAFSALLKGSKNATFGVFINHVDNRGRGRMGQEYQKSVCV